MNYAGPHHRILSDALIKNPFNTAILSIQADFCGLFMTRLTGFTVLGKDYQSCQGQLQQGFYFPERNQQTIPLFIDAGVLPLKFLYYELLANLM